MLVEKAGQGDLVVVAGAGSGLSAKAAEAGGVDALVVYNSGRFRMAGRGSLAGLMPYGDANGIVVEMLQDVVTVVRSTPVIAGVCGTDPFRTHAPFLRELVRLGAAGVQNFPTVGLIDGRFRQALEETGMSYAREVHLIAEAKRMGLFTMPYVFDVEQAAAMIDAGASVLVGHLGLTAGGTIGADDDRTVDEIAPQLTAICDVAASADRFIPVLCHGGPIVEPSDLARVLDAVPSLNGFVGASSIERLPTERGIAAQVEAFKNVRRSV